MALRKCQATGLEPPHQLLKNRCSRTSLTGARLPLWLLKLGVDRKGNAHQTSRTRRLLRVSGEHRNSFARLWTDLSTKVAGSIPAPGTTRILIFGVKPIRALHFFLPNT